MGGIKDPFHMHVWSQLTKASACRQLREREEEKLNDDSILAGSNLEINAKAFVIIQELR